MRARAATPFEWLWTYWAWLRRGGWLGLLVMTAAHGFAAFLFALCTRRAPSTFAGGMFLFFGWAIALGWFGFVALMELIGVLGVVPWLLWLASLILGIRLGWRLGLRLVRRQSPA